MRLSIELSPEQHRQIKAMAALQGKSIKDLVLDKIFEKQKDEDAAWEELMDLLHERIKHAENGGISNRTPEQIAQDVLKRNNAL